MNIFHINNERGALCLSQVGEWVTRRGVDSLVRSENKLNEHRVWDINN